MHEQIPIQKEFGIVTRKGNTFEIKRLGSESVAGSVKLKQEDTPTSHYVASSLNVTPSDQGIGFASRLLAEIEHVSKESGLPIVLFDDVNPEQNGRAVGMYAKRPGWLEVPPSTRSYDYAVHIFGAQNDPGVARLVEYYTPQKTA